MAPITATLDGPNPMTARRSSISSGPAASSSAQQYGRRSSMASSAAPPARRRSKAGGDMSDSINLGVLQHLETVFRSADADGSGELDMEEFVAAFRGVLNTNDGSDDEALRKLFMRIDANCDAVVDWDEFSAYLLMEKTNSSGGLAGAGGAAGSSADGSGGLTFTTVEPAVLPPGVPHRELISGLMHVDNSNGPDKWYSSGRDGTVRVWNGKDLMHLRTFQTPMQCITCASYLPSSGLLALGSYNPCVLVIDPASGEQAGKLPAAAASAALSLTGWQEGGGGGLGLCSSGRELLCVGGADGDVTLMEVFMDELADKKSINRYQGKQLWRSVNHHDWVVAVLQLPQLNSLLSASLDKNLTMTDVERSIPVKTLAGHEKSVTCCGWSGMYKMAISGGDDRQLLLWNPFSCRPLGSLVGHTAPLVAVAVNERDHQIISAAADKTIKVWDLRNQRCLQTLLDRSPFPPGPDDTLSALAYSPARRLLVSGAYALRAWPLTDGRSGGHNGHRDPVSWVGYNIMFAEAVSTDHAGTVCVWHVPTGRLRFRFGNTHGGSRISAATFDNNHRRLITGAEDGTIKVWNFSSGALLSTLATPDYSHDWGSGSGAEVTGLAVSSSNQARNFIATGWDRKVTWYDDNGRRSCGLLRSSSGPSSDVLAAALMQGYPTLATACYDGEVWLWNLESGAVRRKLLPPGHARRPENEQPVERLAFMNNELRHILVAVGADRMMRFWDAYTGSCLLEHFTGHQQGESVAGLALAPDNSTAVTADTAGYIMVWDISGLRLPPVNKSRPGSAVSRPSSAVRQSATGASLLAADPSARTQPGLSGGSSIQRVALWRGHCDAITALDWIPPPTPAAAEAAAESMHLSAAAAAGGSLLAELVATDGSSSNRPHGPSGIASKQQQQQQQQQYHQQSPQHQTQQQTQQVDQAAHNIGYVVSASPDNTLALWSTAGALVGVFGRHTWSMDSTSSWQSQTRAPLKVGEEFDMLVSSNPLEPPSINDAQQKKPQQQCGQQQQQEKQQKSQSNQPPVQHRIDAAQQPPPVLSPGMPTSPQTATPAATLGCATAWGMGPAGSRPHSAATGSLSSSLPASSRPVSGSRLTGQPTVAAAATAAAGVQCQGGVSAVRPASPLSASSRPASGHSSRPPSGTGALSSNPQQHRPRSRPSSSTGFRPSSSSGVRHSSNNGSIQAGRQGAALAPAGEYIEGCAADQASEAAGNGDAEEPLAEGSTPRSIALVCQSSMRQRANAMQTLSSLKRQGSGSSSLGSSMKQLSELFDDASIAAKTATGDGVAATAAAGNGDEADQLIQDIEDNGEEQQLDAQLQQLMYAAARPGRARLSSRDGRPLSSCKHQAGGTAGHAAAAAVDDVGAFGAPSEPSGLVSNVQQAYGDNAAQAQRGAQVGSLPHPPIAASGTAASQPAEEPISKQQQQQSAVFLRSKSRVGFTGIGDIDNETAQECRGSKQQAPGSRLSRRGQLPAIETADAAGDTILTSGDGQSGADDDYEPAVAEDDIPSSLWLPQFGRKPANTLAAQQLMKPQRRISSRPSSAAAGLGTGCIRPASGCSSRSIVFGGGSSVGPGPGSLVRPGSAAPKANW